MLTVSPSELREAYSVPHPCLPAQKAEYSEDNWPVCEKQKIALRTSAFSLSSVVTLPTARQEILCGPPVVLHLIVMTLLKRP